MIRLAILASVFAVGSAHAQAPVTPLALDRNTPLFVCNTAEGKRFSGDQNEYPGQCTKAPQMDAAWYPLVVTKDRTTAMYLDIKTVAWKDKIADISMVIVKPDSSQAVLKDAQSAQDFDMVTRYYYYCGEEKYRSYSVELYRNFRTKPESVKRFDNDKRAVMPIPANSVNSTAYQLICSREYENLLKSK